MSFVHFARHRRSRNAPRRLRLEGLETRLALAVDLDDQLSEAVSLGAASATPRTIGGEINPDTDVDMYSFTVTAGQTVDFDIDTSINGPGGLGSFLRIFNAQNQEIAFNNDGAAPGENTVGFDAYLRFTFGAAGTYFVGVSNANNTLYNAGSGDGDVAGGLNATGSYQLTMTALPVDTDDSLGESIAIGSISTTPITKNGTINPDIDVDIYRFTAGANQTIDFDIDTAANGPGGLGSFLRLFNAQGQEIAFNNDAAAPGETTVGFDAYLRFTFSTAGTYYVGVSNVNNTLYNPNNGGGDAAGGQNSIGAYQLIVQLPTATPIDGDDTITESPSLGAISATPAIRNDAISPDTDVDIFSFTVTAGQTVDFDIDTTANGPGGLGSFLRIFNAQGQELAFNNDAAAPGENVVGFDAYLRFTFAAAGTYYVGVSNATNTLYSPTTGNGDVAGGANSTGNYQLIVQTAPANPVDTDDSLSESISLGAVTTNPNAVDGAISPNVDVDMYRFTVTAGQTVDFDIDTTINGSGGLGSFLRIFNGQGQELAFNDNGAAPGENTVGFDAYLRFTFATAGTYYVGVSNANNTLYNPTTGDGDATGNANATGSYRLTVQGVPVDADDSITEAPSLGTISTTPQTINGSIVTDVDVDLYRFTVTAGQTVDFDIDTVQNGAGGLGSFLRLFNSQGQVLAFNNDAAAPGEGGVGFDAYLRFTFNTAGTYFIGVSNSNNTQYNASTGNGDTAGGPNSIGNYQLIVRVPSATPTAPADTVGLYNPANATFLLRNDNAAGAANAVFAYGATNLTPLAGDWNGDGIDTAGVYRPATGVFQLRNSNSAGTADVSVQFGPGGVDWLPVVGDWDGDGDVTFGLYNAASSTFFLRNSNTGGPAEIIVTYGAAGAGWLPLAGDWDGNGSDSFGLYNPAAGTFLLKNTLAGGPADLVYQFGAAGAGWLPIVGDWNSDGVVTAGLYVQSSSVFFLRNSHAGGPADTSFAYGPSGQTWLPLAGDWDGSFASGTLTAIAGPTSPPSSTSDSAAARDAVLEDDDSLDDVLNTAYWDDDSEEATSIRAAQGEQDTSIADDSGVSNHRSDAGSESIDLASSEFA